jgi:hypothetical protein
MQPDNPDTNAPETPAEPQQPLGYTSEPAPNPDPPPDRPPGPDIQE